MNDTSDSVLDHIEDVLISAAALQERVQTLGAQLTRDYTGKDLLLLSILRGSMVFTADLMRHIALPLELDVMAISSYGDSSTSSGVVRIVKDLEQGLAGRHVLVVEDIVDTGLTLGYLLKTLRLRQPASLAVCALLDKPARRILPVPVDYLGFSIEDKFVVGYGLDYAQHYRHLPCIATLKPEFIQLGKG